TSTQTIELGREVEAAYDTLHNSLSREQQRLLLRFVDAENRFHDEEKLNSFFSGFRLADGSHRELDTIPPYSYEQEDEDRAREIFKQEKAEE
ncbi:MAG: hypothetical protein IJV43_00585, partial [Oscillospiraceae bacterium]|nr:hypothetical protein [Oscillospiraceae bacterium]